MFYDKEIEVWNKGEREHIGGGVYKDRDPEFLMEDSVDIQPYSSAEAKMDYGFDVITTDVMFSDSSSYNIHSTLIKFNECSYLIKEKVVWDSYTEYLLERLQ